jgi:hypothetical protein
MRWSPNGCASRKEVIAEVLLLYSFDSLIQGPLGDVNRVRELLEKKLNNGSLRSSDLLLERQSLLCLLCLVAMTNREIKALDKLFALIPGLFTSLIK